ncbi:MAG TPA: hypothetical protein VK031_00335 [Tissierellaceae bacterium]|nr:hypothetical protein [Tissierellaceae bacterium]
MNYEKQLSSLKENIEKAKSIKYRAEARLEQLKKQEEDIINELKKLDVEPEELDKKIEELTDEIDELFEEANKLLPKELLEKM